MDTLLHNFVADMYGPNFLLLYGVVIIATLLLCGGLVQDPTKNQPLPLIPAEPDPYEVAYLRSQATGIAHLVLFNLIQQGYLQLSKQTISQASNHPDISNLQPVERQVLEKISEPTTAKTSLWLATECVQLFCKAYQEKLDDEQLLYGAKWQEWNINVGLVGAMLIFGLGGYKLLIALGKGHHNVGFLIIMGVSSIIYLLWYVSQHKFLSHLGKRYLQQLQTTFKQLRETSIVNNNLLVLALFGVESFAGTAYNAYYKAFLPSAYSTTSSRSSSSSSSCSSGSSCGGGSSSCSSGSSCGSSCGGGGCGGCGGGCGG
ncbi:TIGR04222 domain-containing membrane protein [Nostoc sp. FACHB-110]|uniref:TIGR04222 domain-containing membrane protein n=1 Tax=Nostoc sp. FACHB-110 TaxID=2692834 RepID=UPI0016849918|nr:TIGR04222 domain-containing membrane protein [Nostoc sp. FACHB-110]MBD2436677.1 TIGR04222 domain-containing membrane protein [Nostoc sp. FACHB-110]